MRTRVADIVTDLRHGLAVADGAAADRTTGRRPAGSSDDEAREIRKSHAPAPEDVITEPRRGRRLRDDPVAIALRKPHRLLEPLET